MEAINKSIKEDLDSMVGKPLLYMGRTVRVKSWVQQGDMIIIHNYGNDISIAVDNLESALDDFKSTSDGQLAQKSNMPVMWDGTAGNIEKLEQTLMKNIDDLNENPDHLEKAKVVQSQAKTVLNIQKFKLDVMKEMRKRGDV